MDSAQAKLVKASAEFENIQSQSQRTLQLVERGIMAKSKADEARAALEGSRAAVTSSSLSRTLATTLTGSMTLPNC